MTSPDPRDPTTNTTRAWVDLSKPVKPGAPSVAPPPPVPPPPAEQVTTPEPDRSRHRRRTPALVLAGLIVVAGVVGALLWWPGDGGAGDDQHAGGGAPGSPSPSLTGTDLLLSMLAEGDCLSMENMLDDVTDPHAAVVSCSDSVHATYSVVSINHRLNASNPCQADTYLKSTAARRVVCLNRNLQAQQCILANAADRFLLSAVNCDATPPAPFTQVLRIAEFRQGGIPLTCAPPLTLATATPARSMCLTRVR